MSKKGGGGLIEGISVKFLVENNDLTQRTFRVQNRINGLTNKVGVFYKKRTI